MVEETSLGLQKSLTINQVLKPWIPMQSFKPERQFQRVVLGEYQSSMVSHSLVWFVTFTTSGKTPG